MSDTLDRKLEDAIRGVKVSEVVIDDFPYETHEQLAAAILRFRSLAAEDDAYNESARYGSITDAEAWSAAGRAMRDARIKIVVKHRRVSLTCVDGDGVKVNRTEEGREYYLTPDRLVLLSDGSYEFVGIHSASSSIKEYVNWRLTARFIVHVEVSGERSLLIEPVEDDNS